MNPVLLPLALPAILLLLACEGSAPAPGSDGRLDQETAAMNKTPRTDHLTEMQYRVTQQGATEPPFSGEYWDTTSEGVYRCVVCGQMLYDSQTKYPSGCGWPSFTEAIADGRVVTRPDHSAGMIRTEILCGNCGAHLGHVFDDGPGPTHKRHCVNSASLRLTPKP